MPSNSLYASSGRPFDRFSSPGYVLQLALRFPWQTFGSFFLARVCPPTRFTLPLADLGVVFPRKGMSPNSLYASPGRLLGRFSSPGYVPQLALRFARQTFRPFFLATVCHLTRFTLPQADLWAVFKRHGMSSNSQVLNVV